VKGAGVERNGQPAEQRTTPRDGLRLAQLLAARLCHDLGGAVGALAGALELAGSEPASAADALQIGTEVAADLVGRLRLWRAAWAQDAAEPMDNAALRRLCRGLPARVRLQAAGLPDDWCWPAGASRVLLNALLLGAECLPAGGVLGLDAVDAQTLLLAPSGAHAAWPAGFAAFAGDPAAAWHAIGAAGPRGVQAPLTALIAAGEGVHLGFALAAAAEAAPPLVLRR
jgi:histidine phosphotransferase ChpT